MWKAYLDTVNEAPVANDTVDVTIRFVEDVSGKTFSKGYNVNSETLKDAASIRSLVAAEIARLTKFDTAVEALKGFVGKEIK